MSKTSPYIRARALNELRDRYPRDPEDVRVYMLDNTMIGAFVQLRVALRELGSVLLDVVFGGWRRV